MSNKQVMNIHITKEQEGTYFTLPFEMPENTENCTIRYSYAEGVVDIGAQAPNQFLGWSGSNKKEITIGQHPSKGYYKKELSAGTYEIMIGAYKIPSENGLDVTYEIEYQPKVARWLSGDLHMHSTASDGQYDTYVLAKKAKKVGLDFIAITDHNNFSENFYLPNIEQLTIIMGVEWTHYMGHMNIMGLPAPFESFVLNTEEDMANFISDVHSKGAIVTANHPKDNGCPYLWSSDDYDLFEIWNGPMRPSNMRAIQMWHELLMEGKRVPIVGGSDYHRSLHPVFLGHPTTRVFAKSNSQEDILEGILAGNAYVTSSPKGPHIEMNVEDKFLNIKVEKAPFMRAELITNLGKVHDFKKEAKVEIQPEWTFAYVIVKAIRVQAITNAVWFD